VSRVGKRRRVKGVKKGKGLGLEKGGRLGVG
jgi:hypothetical protein